MTFPVGIGRTGFQTPAATTKIVAKIVNPTWYPTKAHRFEHNDWATATVGGPPTR
jgi:lipoprotein-anchoring transpeptidase ErfK/SrfK